jgi:hypothetical protein
MVSNAAQLAAEAPKIPGRAKVSGAVIGLTFTVAVFVSAALLFVVEPMFGKMVLPRLGGSPAVWTTCMVFFQGALLLGYLYAHIGPRLLGLRRHTLVHIALLALGLLVLPIHVAEVSGAFRLEHPTIWLLTVLSASLGIPFVLLSSTGPLLQVWFSHTPHPEADNPYFLYAASNAGSLLALVSYPILIEPAINLKGQSAFWSIGYLLLIVLVAVSAWYQKRTGLPLPNTAQSSMPAAAVAISTRTRLRWIFLAFVPSSFFLALTTYVTTDVAAVPLLWIVPLVLYLLSFTIVFGRRAFPWEKLLPWQAIGLIALAIVDFWGASNSAPWLLPLHLTVFFITALVCHGELAATKPPTSHLTDFYLCLALGGALGGVFNALVAPAVFHTVFEYPLTLLVACAVRPRFTKSRSRRLILDLVLVAAASAVLVASRIAAERPVLGYALIASAVLATICLRLSRDPALFALGVGGIVVAGIADQMSVHGTLFKERNFFGVREVRADTQRNMHLLMHGTTKHGAQSTDPIKRRQATSYYYPDGPFGDAFRALPSVPGRRVAVLGLGAGGLAAYAQPGEKWTFYEIDPDIAKLARNPKYFTYLQDTPATVDITLGDGRLSLAQVPNHSYDLIVGDAFSSDAIPVHLLTLEAFTMYLSKLSEDGVLLFHLSNRYLELEPVLAQMIRSTGVVGLIRINTGLPAKVINSGADPSILAVVARRSLYLSRLEGVRGWRPLHLQNGVSLWTDDFSNIFTVFHLPTKARRNALGADKGAAPKPDR